jgi:N-acetylglutamate synthase-like GNAT family acetyltransferase
MTLERLEEFRVVGAKAKAIRQLLGDCFPGYPSNRVYYKQLPHFRFLAWEADQLIAHMAVEHRMVKVGSQPSRIFGVVDLCVHPDFQHRQIASGLLEQLDELARGSEVDFILLVASTPAFYENHGFRPARNLCRWMMLINHQTVGVVNRHLNDILMVKPVSGKPWPEGELDFMGTVF